MLEASQMFMMIDCVRNDVCGEVLYVYRISEIEMFMFLPEIWLSVPEVILEIFFNMMRKICVYLPPN